MNILFFDKKFTIVASLRNVMVITYLRTYLNISKNIQISVSMKFLISDGNILR